LEEFKSLVGGEGVFVKVRDVDAHRQGRIVVARHELFDVGEVD
jgi:hypothetical protein